VSLGTVMEPLAFFPTTTTTVELDGSLPLP